MRIDDLFKTGDRGRDNFRSRLFGMFSEDVVRYWAANDRSPYVCLGRPTIWDGPGFATVDFTLRSRDGRIFVAEQKAEMAWMNYAYLRLERPSQVARHSGKRAFDWFLDAAINPGGRVVKNNGKPITIDGAILVRGAITPEGRSAAIAEYGFTDVLGLEDMLSDLIAWQDPAWSAHVDELAGHASGLFDALR